MRAAGGVRAGVPVRVRQGATRGGEQRAAGELAGDGVRRHPRTVPRPTQALRNRRGRPGHKLHLHGGLRRPRVQLPRVIHPPPTPQSQAPAVRHAASRKPREQADHASVRILRRMPT